MDIVNQWIESVTNWNVTQPTPTQAMLPVATTTAAPTALTPGRAPYILELLPFVEIGVEAVRPGRSHNPPPGFTVACPADRPWCIDYQRSDNGTCMHPDPLEIKRCYDTSCMASPLAPIVFRTQGEQTYCKDFMTPAGRVCQWIDGAACTCVTKSIMYYDGLFVAPGQPIPTGFIPAQPCVYPLDIIKRAAEEAAMKAREGKRSYRERRRGDRKPTDSPDDGSEETPTGDQKKRNPNVPPPSRAENPKSASRPTAVVLTCVLLLHALFV
jgi:hypothetical protein